MRDTLLYASVLIADIIGVAIIVMGLFREHQRLYPSWHKIGLIVMAIGMLAQGVECVNFFLTGFTGTVFGLPMWAFKDYSVAIICGGYVWMAHREIAAARAAAQTSVVAALAATAAKRTVPAKKALTAKKAPAKKPTKKRVTA
jgi:hypothetical protein